MRAKVAVTMTETPAASRYSSSDKDRNGSGMSRRPGDFFSQPGRELMRHCRHDLKRFCGDFSL
ncbi:MAG: hypothetical protein ISN29_11605 [Gammaproteobacteria bacterium AqS3]|nr:hypothetical protein [Gammaproteobacteria bacterium AqS3]